MPIDYRVKFDFTIHFTNGGSLTGEDFRLDLPGPVISEEQLAAFLIADMRLLMAGTVDIRNKVIVAEAHKRAPVELEGLAQRTVDLRQESWTAADLVSQAQAAPVRIIAPTGEGFLLKKL